MDEKKLHPAQYGVEQPEDHEKKTEALFESVYDTKGVKYLLVRKHMDPAVIRANIWQVKGWLDEIRPCEGCRSLSECRQKMKGYHMDLDYDGILHKNLVMCPYMQERENRRTHLGRILINEMPESMYEVSFDTIDIRREENRTASYQKVLNEVWDACEKKQSLFLYGGMGTGKTYLACCAVNETARKGERCAFISWPRFTGEMTAQVRSGEYRDTMELLAYVPFLVIDDIGAEKVTEWNRDELLFSILDQRVSAGRCTWYTSNSDLKKLEEHFALTGNKEEILKASRLMERITTGCLVEALTGKDRRKKI